MGLQINHLIETDDTSEDYVVASQRLCRTEDDRLVSENHPDSRWFYCIAGARIPVSEARRFGLLTDDGAEAEDPAEGQDPAEGEPEVDTIAATGQDSVEGQDPADGEAEVKQAPQPADKARRRAATK